MNCIVYKDQSFKSWTEEERLLTKALLKTGQEIETSTICIAVL